MSLQLRRLARTIVLSLMICADAGLSAQGSTPASAPIEFGGATVSGTLRTRVESWDWFGDSPNGTYTYPGSLLREIGRASCRERV